MSYVNIASSNKFAEDTIVGHNSVVAPGAGTTIAETVPLTGFFRVHVTGGIHSETNIPESDFTNLQFFVGNTSKFIIHYFPEDNHLHGKLSYPHECFFRFNNQKAIIKTINAGSSGVDYHAYVFATKVAD